MPDLLIRIKKKSDGSAALSCERPDGSVTWQRQPGIRAKFFPMHDLTHYAVETVLGHRRGFFGLVAEGWNLTDFGTPWPRGRIPADADPSEWIVGALDLERSLSNHGTAQELMEHVRSTAQASGTAVDVEVSEAQLERIRALRADLFEQWRMLPAGDTLELPFDRPHQVA
jgi:hypothetical protein